MLGVLLFHTGATLPGGYLGVDLFFVLSGYLITSLLLVERAETGRVDLAAFWVRRARRLFPALLSLMPVVALYARFFARPEELRTVRDEALAALAYCANWRAILHEQSYWDLFAAPSPLEHTWSLSIEEQFYVVWPLLCTFLLRRGTRRHLLVVTLILSAASMAAMLLLYDPASTTRVYLGTDTRMAGILFGAALATLLSPNQELGPRLRAALNVSGPLAAILLGVAWCTLRGNSPLLYRGGFWLTELAALVLIACAVAGERNLVARVLELRPLTLLGTISYGLYLWHWPVNVLLSPERAHLHGFWLHALRFALTFVIAIVSYRYLERPIRRHGVPFGRPQYTVPIAIAVSVSLVLHATYAEGRSPAPFATPLPPEQVRMRVMVFGDSTANSLGWTLRQLHEPGVAIELRGKDGCNMLQGNCNETQWVERVRTEHPNVSIIYLAGAFLYGFHVGGDWHTACHPDWDAKFEQLLTQRLRELEAESGLVYTTTVPYPIGPYLPHGQENGEFHARARCINTAIRKAVQAVPGVGLIDVCGWLCPEGVCKQDVGGKEPIRPDGVHFAIGSSENFARWFYGQLQQVQPRAPHASAQASAAPPPSSATVMAEFLSWAGLARFAPRGAGEPEVCAKAPAPTAGICQRTAVPSHAAAQGGEPAQTFRVDYDPRSERVVRLSTTFQGRLECSSMFASRVLRQWSQGQDDVQLCEILDSALVGLQLLVVRGPSTTSAFAFSAEYLARDPAFRARVSGR